MLSKAKVLKGYRLSSRDGEIGMVKEFYFDDQHWTIRYLVADTGNWLTTRQVLISPYALLTVSREEQHIGIDLTRKQIEDSPSLDSDKPVSRQFEAAYYGYFGWPAYWGGPYTWGASSYPYITRDAGQEQESTQMGTPYGLGASATVFPLPGPAAESAQDENTWDAHLRSTHDASGHHIQATDGEIGHVEDFVIDDETWEVRYLVIGTRNWWPGKRVLISPEWIERVSWREKAVFVNLSREAIKQSPEYTEDALLTRDYETKLHGHYSRQGYWVGQPAPKERSR
jgi:uncharacterized protein YrrD